MIGTPLAPLVYEGGCPSEAQDRGEYCGTPLSIHQHFGEFDLR